MNALDGANPGDRLRLAPRRGLVAHVTEYKHPGAADHSYGIQVAKLAGLPASVIERAKVVLAMLEADDRATPRGFDDLPLFATPARPTAPDARQSAFDALVAALAAIHPDELSPREALEALYALKQKAPGGN